MDKNVESKSYEKTMPDWQGFLLLIGLSLGAGTVALMNGIMGSLTTAFPDYPTSTVRMISTMGSLIGALTGIVLTTVFGKKIKYKTTAVVGAVLMLVGGVMPFFLHSSFGIIMVGRVIFGFGFGCAAIRNATIRAIFKNKYEAAKWLGVSQFVVNATSVIGTSIVGALAKNGWHYAFLAYLVLIIPLAVNLFILKEPAQDEEVKKEEIAQVKEKLNLNPRVWLYVVLILAMVLWVYPVMSGTSNFLTDRAIGDVALIATVVSMYNLGSALCSATFGNIYKKLGSIGFGSFAVGVAIGFITLLASRSLFVAGIGTFLCGACSSICRLYLIQWAGDISKQPRAKNFVTTLLTACISLASFLSSYWITACKYMGRAFTMFSSETERTFCIGAILFIILGVITIIKPPVPKEK